MTVRSILALTCVVWTACVDSTPDSDASLPDSGAIEPVTVRADSVMQDGPNFFDPGAIVVGDTILGLRVKSKNVTRAFGDSVWVGSVVFDGEIEVSGVYQPHFDYPEVQSLCFHVDSVSSLRIPEFAPDAQTSPNGKPWFCFQNPERARSLLGASDSIRFATIVIDEYDQNRHFTDAFDVARLVRVIQRDTVRTAGTLQGMQRFAR